MEYNFFRKIQSLPLYIRVPIGVGFLSLGILAMILPIIPGGILFIVIGLLFLVKGKKIKKVRKIRKGLQHLMQNISKARLKHKWYDFKNHIKHLWKH